MWIHSIQMKTYHSFLLFMFLSPKTNIRKDENVGTYYFKNLESKIFIKKVK